MSGRDNTFSAEHAVECRFLYAPAPDEYTDENGEKITLRSFPRLIPGILEIENGRVVLSRYQDGGIRMVTEASERLEDVYGLEIKPSLKSRLPLTPIFIVAAVLLAVAGYFLLQTYFSWIEAEEIDPEAWFFYLVAAVVALVFGFKVFGSQVLKLWGRFRWTGVEIQSSGKDFIVYVEPALEDKLMELLACPNLMPQHKLPK
jgi:hypothetical protein